MIQRIQTLYLTIAAICGILLFFFPVADFYNEVQGNYKFYIHGIRCMDPEPKLTFSFLFSLPAILLTAVSVIFSVVSIALYKNRAVQLRIVSFNVITIVVLILVLFFFYTAELKTMTGTDPVYHYPGMLLPVAALLMQVLANRAIRKDDQKVKAADRIR